MGVQKIKKNRVIAARAPLRLGLAGGGSDVDPFCSTYGGRVLNVTISDYVYSTVSKSDGPSRLNSLDQSSEVVDFESDTRAPSFVTLPLHFGTYLYFQEHYPELDLSGLQLSTYTDAPIGSGLGTSSTLVVSLVKGISAFFKLEMNKHEIASAAHVIEREICGFKGGRQDSYAATFGGFNYMSFEAERNSITPIKVPATYQSQLESQLILYHLGTSRVSSEIIEEQSRSVEDGSSSNFEAMIKIRSEAKVMRDLILKGDFTGVANSLLSGWENKKASSSRVSSPEIDEVYELGLKSGASAGKVSGAGGGGFMLFMTPIHHRANLVNNLRAIGGAISQVGFTSEGATAWQIS